MINKLKWMLIALVMGTCAPALSHAQGNKAGGSKWPLPKSFVSPKANTIDYKERLAPFFKKLADYEKAVTQGNDSLPKPRVMMIGDSHVRGNILPRQVRDSLAQVWDIDFKYFCKNGVQLNYFVKQEQMDTILAYNPDLLIVAVGTNEAHSNFVAKRYTDLMQRFVDQVLTGTDSTTTIMFTTPPGSHKRMSTKTSKGRSRTSIVPNDTNKDVADCQDQFCKDNGFAIWNLLEIAGGKEAPRNWREAQLMQKDGIHYTVNAYRLQGNMLAWALIDARKTLSQRERQHGNKKVND